MPRAHVPMRPPPAGEAAWPVLNQALFGSVASGGHDTPPRPVALPVDWASVFGRTAPLTLEIGFNRGRFLAGMARAWPDHDHLGIEVRRRFAWHAAHALAEAGGPRNVRVIWGDGRLLLPALFPASTLSALFVTFPDPWWKRRHAKRRLVDARFAADAAAALRPGGRVWVKSDLEAVASAIADVFAAIEAFGPPVTFAADALPPTLRETKCLARGLPITRFYVERQSTAKNATS